MSKVLLHAWGDEDSTAREALFEAWRRRGHKCRKGASESETAIKS